MIVEPKRLVAGGDCLCRTKDGQVIFVPAALPGDEITVEITEQKGSYVRAAITSLDVESSDRVSPPCLRRREGCGGCDWQHLAVPAQLQAKVEIVRDAFRRIGKMPAAHIEMGQAVAAVEYRTTIRVVGDQHGRPAYRRQESNETVPATGCIIAHPALEAVLEKISLSPGLELTLRVSAANGAMTAHWDPQQGAVDGLGDQVHIGRRAYLTERVDGQQLRVSAASFFQSGPAAAQLLVDTVRRMTPELASAAVVLDAYAGMGLFAATVAAPGAHVIAVELSKAAVLDCRVNLANRPADIEQLEFSQWQPNGRGPIDVALADPARSGLAKPGVKALLRANAPVIVLVNCDPVSAARDAKLLTEAGYTHESTTVLDLFPNTHHVETVTRFTR